MKKDALFEIFYSKLGIKIKELDKDAALKMSDDEKKKWEEDESNRAKEEKKKICDAFSDIGRVLHFESMSQDDLEKIFYEMVNIKIKITLPTKKQREKYYNAAENVLKALREAVDPTLEWGGFTPDFYMRVSLINSELEEVMETKKTWGLGRHDQINIYQRRAIHYLYDKLKISQKNKSTKVHWKNFKIKQIGIFMSENDTPEQMYYATPARLISNYAKSIGVDIPEITIDAEIKKMRKKNKKITS